MAKSLKTESQRTIIQADGKTAEEAVREVRINTIALAMMLAAPWSVQNPYAPTVSCRMVQAPALSTPVVQAPKAGTTILLPQR